MCFIKNKEGNLMVLMIGSQGKKKRVKKDGFGNHSEATINLNLKLNYENSYFTLSI
ncbi:hypothetical protein SAMN04488522_107168 [Pedobacter caeni]|uniref:Uncharacterized protein n=1 Tax=Pedobacter caeni TaxID=288992 RepID=A0A1M5MG44_9SPHI|nr:hypothetical protein SAMN04488522_107168 [Pedobacter caeni]